MTNNIQLDLQRRRAFAEGETFGDVGAIIAGDCFRYGFCLNFNAGVYTRVVSAPVSGSAMGCLDTKTIRRGGFVDGISGAVLIAIYAVVCRGKQRIRYWRCGQQPRSIRPIN